ncbi:hypothetical protein Hanom_Chr06g00561051 [Helianthus anomalus]
MLDSRTNKQTRTINYKFLQKRKTLKNSPTINFFLPIHIKLINIHPTLKNPSSLYS